MSSHTRVLFVCLGNICRSPLAEALFHKKLEESHKKHLFSVDSAGTSGFHQGEKADPRTRKNAQRHGVEITHLARQFRESDFQNFDIIVTMDHGNRDDVLEFASNEADKLKVRLLLDHVAGMEGKEVPDPWYGEEEGFEQVYNLLDHATSEMLAALTKKS